MARNNTDGLILAMNAPTKETMLATLGGLIFLADVGYLQKCRVHISHRFGNILSFQLNQILGTASDTASITLSNDDSEPATHTRPVGLVDMSILHAGVEQLLPPHSVSFDDPTTPLGRIIVKHMIPSTFSFVQKNQEFDTMRSFGHAITQAIGTRFRYCCKRKSTVNSAYYELADKWAQRVSLFSTYNEVFVYSTGRAMLCLEELCSADEMRLYSHLETHIHSVFAGYSVDEQRSVLFHNQAEGSVFGEWITPETQETHAYYTQTLPVHDDVSSDIIASLCIDPCRFGDFSLPNSTVRSSLLLDPTLKHASDLYYQYLRMPNMKNVCEQPEDDDWLQKTLFEHPSRRVILLDGIRKNAYFIDNDPHVHARAEVSISEYCANSGLESVQLYNLSLASYCDDIFAHDDAYATARKLCTYSTTTSTAGLTLLECYQLVDWGYFVTKQAYQDGRIPVGVCGV